MAEILKGAAVATAITESLAQRSKELREKGIIPTLEILRVGEREDDLSYEKGAMSRCGKAGIEIKHVVLKADASKQQILYEIKKANENASIHGLLMFRPLEDKTAEAEATKLLSPAKDMDSMTQQSMARVFTGNGEGYAPCTAESCIEILKYYGVELKGANVAVIGRSQVIGKPVSMLLQAENATVTMCHTKTKNLAEVLKNADIIIAAAGKAEMVTKDYVREGQIVIDVGINVNEEGKLCGDVAFDEVSEIVKAITPVPGGVGSVTTSILAAHLIDAAEKIANQII